MNQLSPLSVARWRSLCPDLGTAGLDRTPAASRPALPLPVLLGDIGRPGRRLAEEPHRLADHGIASLRGRPGGMLARGLTDEEREERGLLAVATRVVEPGRRRPLGRDRLAR